MSDEPLLREALAAVKDLYSAVVTFGIETRDPAKIRKLADRIEARLREFHMESTDE